MATSPLHTVDTDHLDFVHDAQLDFYGRRLATCSSDRQIKVYDIIGETHKHVTDLTGHSGPVWEVAWAHPSFGVLLASCSHDGKVIIHREAPENVGGEANEPTENRWQPYHIFDGHKDSVNSICWSPHELGLNLASGSSDGKVAVLSRKKDNTWETKTIDVCPLGVTSVSWAPFVHVGFRDGDATAQRLAVASCDGSVRVYRRSTVGQAEWELDGAPLEGHSDWARDVCWAESHGLTVNVLASCSEDGTVLIWRQTRPGAEWIRTEVHKFDTPVWRVSWSATGNVLAVSSGEHEVTLWRENVEHQWVKLDTVADRDEPTFEGSEKASAE